LIIENKDVKAFEHLAKISAKERFSLLQTPLAAQFMVQNYSQFHAQSFAVSFAQNLDERFLAQAWLTAELSGNTEFAQKCLERIPEDKREVFMENAAKETAEFLIASQKDENFQCPISRCTMKQPVALDNGRKYWFESDLIKKSLSQNPLNPITFEPVTIADLKRISDDEEFFQNYQKFIFGMNHAQNLEQILTRFNLNELATQLKLCATEFNKDETLTEDEPHTTVQRPQTLHKNWCNIL